MADAGGIAADRLKSFIERIERLEEEKAAIAGDIREVYSEAKSTGFETKIMRQVVRLRKMEAHDREEQEQLLDLYKRAVGLEGYRDPGPIEKPPAEIRSGGPDTPGADAMMPPWRTLAASSSSRPRS